MIYPFFTIITFSMQKYQIIPRKFRPQRFSEVVGQEAIVTTLQNALQSERLGQAYLFSGSRGCGKTTLARLFAKALNCSLRGKDREPCNHCPSCLEITEGCNLDIIEIDGASNRGIDDIRQINETVGYAPSKGLFKIYIIDEVHMLTKEAFNALLKTLEEPPKNVKFFFATTEPHKIPATIISRCQRFDLGRIPEQAMKEKLMAIATTLGIQIEEKAIMQIVRLSEGALRDAESLLDQLICFGKTPITYALTCEVFGLISQDFLIELDAVIQKGDIDKAILLAQKVFDTGKDINATIDMLLWHFRTHLFIKPKPVYSKDQCLHILDLLLDWHEQMLKTPFKQVYLELLFINLARSTHSISMENLVHRLIALEQRLQDQQSSQTPSTSFTPSEQLKLVEPLLEQARERTPKIKQTSLAPQPLVEEVKPKPQPVAEEPKPQTKPIPSVKQVEESVHPSKFDTLIRFAAVELEGIVKKQGS